MDPAEAAIAALVATVEQDAKSNGHSLRAWRVINSGKGWVGYTTCEKCKRLLWVDGEDREMVEYEEERF